VEFEERESQERFEFEDASEILESDAVVGGEISWLMMNSTLLLRCVTENAVWVFIWLWQRVSRVWVRGGYRRERL